VLDINGSMLGVGAERAVKKGYAANLDFVEANAEELPFDGCELRRLHHRLRHSQCARHRQGAQGSLPGAPARRPLSLPRILRGRDAAARQVYDAWSFNGIPAMGKAIAGDAEPYQYLVESIRKFPRQDRFRRDDRTRRLLARRLHQLHRRHRSPSFRPGSSRPMASLGTYLRLLRAGIILVREGVISSLPADDLPCPAAIRSQVLPGCLPSAAPKARSAPTGLPAPSSGLARPGSSLASSSPRGPMWSAPRLPTISQACRTEWRHSRNREARTAIEGSLGRPIGELYHALRSADRGSLDSTGSSRRSHRRNRVRKVAVKVVRPGVRQRFKRDLEAFYLVSETAGTVHSGVAPVAARWRSPKRSSRPHASKWTCGWRPRRCRRWPTTPATIRASGCLRSIGSAPGAMCVTMEWIDGIKMSDVAGLRAAGHDLDALADTLIQSFLRHTLRDGFLPCRHAPGQSLRRPDRRHRRC
jgi:hypothetical protein